MNTALEFTQEGQSKPTENPEGLIGKRVEYQDAFGTVKYVGPLKHNNNQQDANQTWLGIQWDNSYRGKHNGTVEGIKYFSCDDGANSGSLLKLDKANFGMNIFDGIHLRYFNMSGKMNSSSVNQKGESVEYDEEVYFETVRKFKKKVEFVGFSKIWQKLHDLKNLRELSLPYCRISDIGPDGSLSSVLPNLRTLSLEGNLLYDWNQVFLIGRELKYLQELSISRNKLPDLEKDVRDLDEIKINSNTTVIKEAPLNVFGNLKNIVLISMNLTWKSLSKLLPIFMNVEGFVLCSNKLNDFENLTYSGSDFKNLKFLNLEDNDIKKFDGINEKFKDAPKLSKLILNINGLNELGPVSGFNNVNMIIIEENNITGYKIFSQLNQFPRLENLRITKNPISKKFNPIHIRQRAIAEIKNLKVINGGELKKYERKDCEIYYLRNTFHEFFAESGQTAFDYDFVDFEKFCEGKHPRIPELIKMYGNPYDESVKNKPKTQTVAPKMASLINLKLTAFSGPYLGKPAVMKKFTDNTLITNLKAMLAKQFGIPATKQKIYCKADPHDPFTIMEEDLKDLKFYGVKQGHEIWVGDTEL